MTLVRLFLFFLSSLGFWETLRLGCKDKLGLYFLPSLTIAIQTTILFLAGLLNLLPEAVCVLYLLGFCGLISRIYPDRGIRFVRNYLNTGYVFLMAVLGIMACYVRGKVFIHYDNFSHWALVVQQMLMHDRFPNFQDTLIQFQEYPLGSSVYIYFFAKLIGTGESVQMLAQIYMLAAAALPLFSFIKQNKALSTVVMLFFLYFIFFYNIAITDLLVDTLLPMVGCCGLLFSAMHCKKGCKKRMVWLASVYMVQAVQIKNSGIFFAASIAMSILCSTRHSKNLRHSVLCILFPVFTLLLWQKHCDYVFLASATSKHAMTVRNYQTILGAKTAEDLRNICISFFKFAGYWKHIWLVAALFAAFGCLILLWNKSLLKLYKHVFLASVGMYLLYQTGMLTMYIFSMPTGEALHLASIERYSKSILIAIIYLDMIPVLTLLSTVQGKNIQMFFATACVCISLYFFTCVALHSFTPTAEFSAESRIWLENAKYEYHVPEYSSYCVLRSTSDYGYTYWVLLYLYHSTDIREIYVENSECLANISEHNIFIFDPEDPIVLDWVSTNFPDQVGNRVILQ